MGFSCHWLHLSSVYAHTYFHSKHYSQQSLRPWWRHQMETFSALLALCEGNPPVTGGFPSQGPVTRGFDVFFDLLLKKNKNKKKNGWANTRDAGDLRRHHAQYDVIRMKVAVYYFSGNRWNRLYDYDRWWFLRYPLTSPTHTYTYRTHTPHERQCISYHRQIDC